MTENAPDHVNASLCGCAESSHDCRLVVLTGGPSAGKTAVLELARRYFCRHVIVVPEAASIIFGGGFWRRGTLPARKAAQRAIYHVQREQESILDEEGAATIGLCDRGTLDGVAYWPETMETFMDELGTNIEAEYARYKAVIHLRTPANANWYNHDNPMRIETIGQAQLIDQRLLQVWRHHPRRHVIPAAANFLEKAAAALEVLQQELPECCRARRPLPTGTR